MKKIKEEKAIKCLERILDKLFKFHQLDKFNSIVELLCSNGYKINLVDNHYKITK